MLLLPGQSNFAVQSESGNVRLRRADRAFHSWGIELCPFLTASCRLLSFPEVTVSFQYATEHRCAVVLRGPRLSDCITGTDPLVDGRPLLRCQPTVLAGHAEYEDAERTSEVVNELSAVVSQLLSRHPLIVRRRGEGLPFTNLVLLRGAGKRTHVPPFTWPPAATAEGALVTVRERQAAGERTTRGSAAFVVAPTAIIGGLALSLDMRRIHCAGATGDYRTDLCKKAEEAARALIDGPHSFGLLHVKVAPHRMLHLRCRCVRLNATARPNGAATGCSHGPTSCLLCRVRRWTTPVTTAAWRGKRSGLLTWTQ